MTSFPAFTLLFVQKYSFIIIKRKLHGDLKIQILCSRGNKQYFIRYLSYNQCHFVETLSLQLCFPPSPTRQCWKKVSTKLMKTSAHNTMQH